jgi:hypothetical protein
MPQWVPRNAAKHTFFFVSRTRLPLILALTPTKSALKRPLRPTGFGFQCDNMRKADCSIG